jgi:outer membrane protein OmpA-like peptidoglycan-associated protein
VGCDPNAVGFQFRVIDGGTSYPDPRARYFNHATFVTGMRAARTVTKASDALKALRWRWPVSSGAPRSCPGFATSLAPKENEIENQLARLGAKVTQTEVVIQFPGSILFDFDSANIRPDADRALNDVAQVIKAYESRSVRVEGHTDSVASDEYNQSLSERRAASVADWFSNNGIERRHLSAIGHGEKKPVATNDTAAGRQLNRRVGGRDRQETIVRDFRCVLSPIWSANAAYDSQANPNSGRGATLAVK